MGAALQMCNSASLFSKEHPSSPVASTSSAMVMSDHDGESLPPAQAPVDVLPVEEESPKVRGKRKAKEVF